MIIKKYVVNDMKEALIRAKYELGKEAIIISQKTVRPGKWYQVFKKKMLEVTVAVEDQVHEKTKREKEKFRNLFQEPERMEKSSSEAIILHAKETLKMTLEKSIKKELAKEIAISDKYERVFKDADAVQKKFEIYREKYSIQEEVSLESLKGFVKEFYAENAFMRKKSFEHLNVLIGPTGVGKTTTIAKIASTALLEENKSVGLLTIDTYRIAAVEQLRKYAEILSIQFETVDDSSQIKEKLDLLKNNDIILVDTIGASPKDEERLEDIKNYLNELPEERNTYLSISMSQDTDTVKRILETYKELRYDALILTKFDEVENFKNFWNILENNVVPVQYFCHGQEVPEDLQEGNLENVMEYLWEELKS